VLFAQLVDDPSSHPDIFPTEDLQKKERERLHGIISRLVIWENIQDQKLLEEAYAEILKSTNESPPAILDPFAGGGSIPLEAQRLGLEANASDLNPVAVLINKALIELPSKWAGSPPVFPGAADERLSWPSANGLATDVRLYGMWMRDTAQKRIGHLYPKVKISGVDATVIAWIWTHTVTCPNPACAGMMPLARSFWLSRKKGKERYIIPISGGKRIRFKIGGPDGAPREGTVGRAGAECLLCNTPVPLSYIRAEGKAGRMGIQLMAIVAEGPRQRYYIAPTDEHENAAGVTRPVAVPDAELPEQALGFRIQAYGMTTWSDLFTNRQLTILTTLCDLVREAYDRIINDGANPDYALAVATQLAFTVSKVADRNSVICTWADNREHARNTFVRQAIPMTWDFAESNPFSGSSGNFFGGVESIEQLIRSLPTHPAGKAIQESANSSAHTGMLISTDPPYYDNVGYSDLADFFYVWLRRSIGEFYPGLMSTMLTPKSQELVADPFRHGSRQNAEQFFERGFTEIFTKLCETTPVDFPITVFYAFKQSETDGEGGHASTGWETLLEGMLQAGWAITATWPMRTELSRRMRNFDSNALASSIVLACRRRPANAGFIDRRDFIGALRSELPEALRNLEQAKIAPVDLRQAAIGPGMALFSRYARVNEPDGSPMRVRAALSLINQVLDEKLSQLEGDVSAGTRWCVEWFKQCGFDSGPFGTAEMLSKGIDTSITGLERAGVLTSRAGRVKLLSVRELPDFYDPAANDRTSEWEICLHLAKALQDRGADEAARLMATARDVPGIDLDDVRELSYLLYSIAEKKNWAETALLFNNLGTSWTDIEDASRKVTAGSAGGQGEFTLEFGSDDDGDE
jgi:putative DNA methylase